MSQENVDTIRHAVAALNARDLEGYLACCTEDVELHTPLEAVAGTYEGRVGIQRYLTDIEDAGPDFHIDLRDLEAIGDDQVLGFMQVGSTGRASGIPIATEATTVYDLIDGKISRVRIFLDRHEAFKAVGLAE
jgi:ketosteroid isomerase-like protein